MRKFLYLIDPGNDLPGLGTWPVSMTTDGKKLYATTANTVLALKLDDLSTVWQRASDEGSFPVYNSILFNGANLFAAIAGFITERDLDDGSVLSHNDLKDRGRNAVDMQMAGEILVAGINGYVAGLRLREE